MERQDEEGANFILDKLKVDFDQLMVECANITDEIGSYKELEDGRVMMRAEWIDAEDVRCYLRAFTQVDPATSLGPLEKRKLRTDYFFDRIINLPDRPDERYNFMSIQQRVQVRGDDGFGVLNEDPADDLKYLTVILKSLQERPTRKKIDTRLYGIALGLLIDHDDDVQNQIMIDHFGRHANQTVVEYTAQTILKKEAILRDVQTLVNEAVEAERTRRGLTQSRLELE